ncbi:MAG: metal ABC transporter substrate-binding protein [Lachnospiraceae bacterium]|nr:metal ABC transporter substrate-binding protein [Lachnospiraceae bacterium]
MKKRILALMLSAGMMISAFTGCKASASSKATGNGDKYSIVCTSFPQYDWVKNLVKGLDDKFDVTYLMGSGVDLHSYQASAQDIAKIGKADLFIYVGGESDVWVDGAIKNATNKNIQTVNMVKAIGDNIKEEEAVEGMEPEHEHDEDEAHGKKDEHDHDHHDGDEIEYDEHVWLSLKNAQKIVAQISDKIQGIDKKDATKIDANTESYLKKLSDLDNKYEEAVKSSDHKTVLFGDRFPFRYLVDDYNLQYFAAFVGCSAETEASFKTISFLANKVDELNLPVILTIENSDDKIANTIKKNTKSQNQKIEVMDSLQSVSTDDIKGGKTYLKTMESNLNTLKDALK